MDNCTYILPIPDSLLSQTKDEMFADLTKNSQTTSKLNLGHQHLFKNLYDMIFTRLIEYDSIYSHLSLILEHIVNSEDILDYLGIIEYIFKIELLCDNFYHQLKCGIDKETMEKFKISFVALEYPILKRRKYLNLNPLIEIMQTNNIAKSSIGDILICYKINQELSYKKDSEDSFCAVEPEIVNIKPFVINRFIIEDILLFEECTAYLLLYILNLEDIKYFSYLLKDTTRLADHKFFFLDNVEFEFVYDKLFNVLECSEKLEILKKYPSHFLINKFYDDLHREEEMDELIVESYYEGNLETINLLHKIFENDTEQGEKIMKRIILIFKEKRFRRMFLDKCNNVDIEFIEIFMLYLDNISGISDELFKNIISSPYFGILSNDINIFREFIDRSVQIIDDIKIHKIIDIIFYENMRIKEEVILKMEYLLIKFHDIREYLFSKFRSILRSIEKKCQPNADNTIAIDSIKSSDSVLSIKNPDNFKICVYNVINLFRMEPGVFDFSDFIINYDFNIFLDNCLFKKTDLLDQFFIGFVNLILSNKDIPGKDVFSLKFISYTKSVENPDYYWNMSAKKYLKMENLVEFLQDQNLETSFFVKYIYNEKYLMNLLGEKMMPPDFDYELINQILKTLEMYASYQSGIVFYDSFLKFNLQTNTFCLYIIAIQYDTHGEQSLLKLEGEDLKIELLVMDCKIIEEITVGDYTERILIDSEIFPENKISIGMRYSKGHIRISLNKKNHIIKNRSVSKIMIGARFRGIIEKVLYYENNHFKNEYLCDANRSCFFVSTLCSLEKKLIFRNENGFYIDNMVSYLFNKQMDIEISNVITNISVKWVHNFSVCDKIFKETKKNVKLANIIEKYVEQTYLNLKLKR